MITAHRIEVVLSEDGRLSLANLPFRAGEAVEVTIRSAFGPKGTTERPLRGMVLHYDQPAAPVAESDWEATQ